jgi:hypothetical protein
MPGWRKRKSESGGFVLTRCSILTPGCGKQLAPKGNGHGKANRPRGDPARNKVIVTWMTPKPATREWFFAPCTVLVTAYDS